MWAFSSSTVPYASTRTSVLDTRTPPLRLVIPPSPVRVYTLLFFIFSVYLKIHNIILPLLGTVIKHKTVVVEIESHHGFRQAFHVVPRPQSRF